MSLDLVEINNISEFILYNIHKVKDGNFAKQVIDNSDNLNLEHKGLFIVCAEFFKINNKYPDYIFLQDHGADFAEANYKKETEEGSGIFVLKEFSTDTALDFGNRIHRVNIQIEVQEATQLGDFDEVQRLISTVRQDKQTWNVTQDWSFEAGDQEWLVEGCMPQGRVTYFAGWGNIGKSRLALQMSCSIAMGRPEWLEGGPLLGTEGPRNVVYVSYEDTKSNLKRRFSDWAEVDKINNHFFAIHPEGAEFWNKSTKPGEDTDFFRFVTELCEEKEAALLIIDPLTAAFLGNENDRMEVRDFMGMMDRWAIKSNCTVLLIAHPPKDKDHDWSGSTDWLNASRCVWIMAKRIRDDHNRPKRIPKNDQDSPHAVCLSFEKNSYGKMLDPLWLKDKYPDWQVTEFFDAAYEQMTDEQREEQRRKMNDSLKEVSKELDSDDSLTSIDLERLIQELDPQVWDESTLEEITQEVYGYEEIETVKKSETQKISELLTKFGWTSKRIRKDGKQPVCWFVPVS